MQILLEVTRTHVVADDGFVEAIEQKKAPKAFSFEIERKRPKAAVPASQQNSGLQLIRQPAEVRGPLLI